MKIDKDNYMETLPIIKQYLPDDAEVKEYIAMFEELVQADDLHEPGNEIALQELTEFYKLINEWIDSGVINIPEQKKTSIFRPTTRPTYQSADNIKQKNINNKVFVAGNAGDLSRFGVNRLTSGPVILIPEQNKQIEFAEKLNPIALYEQKKSPEVVATTKPTEPLSENDKKIIKELELPESKLYIYKEIRKRLGRPISSAVLANYGVNNFARQLMGTYPEGYRKTEIKSVLNMVLMYDQLEIG